MSDLVVADKWGNIAPVQHFRKAPAPKMGNAYAHWAGRDYVHLSLPGGAVLQFDLSRLTLADYRVMRDHYQVNATLSVLTFVLHQIDWSITCDDQKIADGIEENLREIWPQLIRSFAQSFWAGYSPMVLDYENNPVSGRTEVRRIKDLIPEECTVNWKQVEGWAPPGHLKPKYNEYDGIKQAGLGFPIPADNTLWYPLLMENGDHYGRKLLRPAFPSWFFSTLIHLFANRYFERFGEPVPVGRANFDDEVETSDGITNGRAAMETILTNLRNRSVVVLPSDRDPETKEYDYDIEYLESQMRGVDFERYMMRLDEEISLSMFTPLLMLRTADVGSYNLGVTHTQMYLWMLNALAGDMKFYLDRYLVERLKSFNHSPKAPRAQWTPRALGRDNVETLRAIVTAMIAGNMAKPDLDELGTALGLSLEEIRIVTEPTADPTADPRTGQGRPERIPNGPQRDVRDTRAPRRSIAARLRPQVIKAYAAEKASSFQPDLGFRRQMVEAAGDADLVDAWYRRMDLFIADAPALFDTAEAYIGALESAMDAQADALGL